MSVQAKTGTFMEDARRRQDSGIAPKLDGADNNLGVLVPLRKITFGEAEVVAAMRAKSPGADEAFFEQYAPLVQRVVARVLGPDPELADVLQEVFLQAFACISKAPEPPKLRAWVTSIAVFTARGWIRRRRRRAWLKFFPPNDVPDVAGPSPSPELSEALKRTYAILNLFDPDERVVFALRFIDGMELTEIASVCKISLATTKRRLARAQKAFIALGQKDPALEAWLEGGSRWNQR